MRESDSMMRAALKAFCFCLLALSVWMGATRADDARPNLVFIVADDLGYGDLSCFGHPEIQTPNLDRLAKGGVRFTQAYAAAPVCTPSRTAMMTGRYPARTQVGLREPLDWGVHEDQIVGLTPSDVSLPMVLKKQGYRTHLIGKWHLGFAPEFSANANGFDTFYGYLGGGIDYVSHTDPSGKVDLYRNEKPVVEEGYATDLFADEAVSILREKHTSPFFLSLQFSAPHWPWQEPGATTYPKGGKAWKQGGSSATYRAMVERMDQAIGKVVAAIEENGLASNTLIVFTSDNGGERFSSMGGLKEKKFVLWEGGIRVPAIAYWPGKIPSGMTSSQPVIHMDWAATFLELAGGRADDTHPLDGMNVLRLLDGKETMDRTFFWRVHQRNQQKAMRLGRWKYLKTEQGEFLFDLDEDPTEDHDLKAEEPDVFRSLVAKYSEWEANVLAPVPLPKAP